MYKIMKVNFLRARAKEEKESDLKKENRIFF